MEVSGKLCLFGGLHALDVAPEILNGRRSVRARSTLKGVQHMSYIFRLRGGEARLVVPDTVVEKTGVKVGDEVEVAVAVIGGTKELGVPRDVELALANAGTSLGVLPDFERRQLLYLVRESKEPSVRRGRIEAVVSACLSKEAC